MESKKCILSECKDAVKSRGLCIAHYNYAKELVKKKQHTWQEFEELGLSVAPKRGKHSVKRDMFDEQLAKAIDNK